MPTLAERDVERFVSWWAAHLGSGEDLLADDFVFASHLLEQTRADFLLGVRIAEAQEEVRVLGVLVGASQASTFFEGVDPRTNVVHRTAWLLDHESGRIRRITAVFGLVQRPSA